MNGDEFPASFAQESLSESGAAATIVPLVRRVHGPLDVPRLGDALGALVHRHDALRTRLSRLSDGAVVQRVLHSDPITVERAGPRGEWLDTVREELTRPFDLTGSESLIRASVITLGHCDHVLVMCAHHAIADGWSADLLGQELEMVYRERSSATLPPLAMQYGDYAVWERSFAPRRALDFWAATLEQSDRLFEGVCRTLRPVPGELPPLPPGPALSAVAELHRTTIPTVIVAAVIASLGDLIKDSVTVGMWKSNRHYPDMRQVVGMVADLLPLTVYVGDNPSFSRLITRVAKTIHEGHEHAVPFGSLRSSLPRLCRVGPRLDVAVNFLPPRGSSPSDIPQFFDPVDIAPWRTPRQGWWDGTAVLEYRLHSGNHGDVGGYLVADAVAVGQQLASDLSRRLQVVAGRAVHDCSLPLSELRALR